MAIIATNYPISENENIFRGEVRDIYKVNEQLISVATDRLTVFGHLFPDPIPFKGQVLNQITNFFAKQTEDIVPNWIEFMPDPNVLVGKKCERFNVNFVIRGSLIGHAWRIYENGVRTICGIDLPDGMNEFDLFEEPIITPTTKVQNGFEEDITGNEIIDRGIMSEAQLERLNMVTRQLFIRGKQIARQKGLVLADTKYEFGLHNNEIYLIDDIHTPDTSRYFLLNDYETYIKTREVKPKHLSKEFIRQWLLNRGFSGLGEQEVPDIPNDLVNELSQLYTSLYERITGEYFKKHVENEDPITRIEKNINNVLESMKKPLK